MKFVIEYIKIDDRVIDEGDPFKIIDPVWWTATIYDGEQKYVESLTSFSREQCLLHAVYWYRAEVNNGGHDQFYFNSTGIVWKNALEGFKELGVGEVVSIIEESASRLGGNPSLDRAKRQQQLDEYAPDFEDLDDRFFTFEKNVNLDEVMLQYIFRNRSAFYFEGNVQKRRA